ncbi:MAG: hypothetical protein FKY71_09810 [Spiribacter salinus]|uniref:Uncharacterized protein n=1 Tax=Spiribacter salinus TaxID=1335746 RepID=A0A540VR15_9GAMM|nr:MAG: hypothetical protein FKY71_09810 [Spiribacter salinus]
MDTREIAHQVDDLLMEQGEYVPVELLLRLGRLAYNDYEQWRRGTLPTLAEALQGSPKRITGVLQDAASHCHSLGLEAQSRRYTPWGAADDIAALCLARAEALASLLGTSYRPSPERAQMDLFFDSRETVLESRLREALVGGDRASSESRLAELTDERPDHPNLGAYAVLVDGVSMPANPPEAASVYLEHIEARLEPCATDCLGAEARDYLAPHWRALGGMLNEAVFDSDQPRVHRSYTAARLGYWDEVRAAVEDTSGWWKQPVLVQRLWRAAEHLRDLAIVWQCVCLLCWDHPAHAPEALRESLHFAAASRAFGELDEVLEIGDFPAWYALCHRQCLPDVPADNREAIATAAVVNALITAAARDPGGPEEIEQRRALKAACPALFRQYMGPNS